MGLDPGLDVPVLHFLVVYVTLKHPLCLPGFFAHFIEVGRNPFSVGRQLGEVIECS